MAITNAVCIAHIGLPFGVACFLLTMQTLAVRTSANHGSWDGKPSAHYSSERQHKSRHWVWRSACARFPTLPALVVLIDFVGRLYSASQELRRPPLLLSNLGFPAASERREDPLHRPQPCTLHTSSAFFLVAAAHLHRIWSMSCVLLLPCESKYSQSLPSAFFCTKTCARMIRHPPPAAHLTGEPGRPASRRAPYRVGARHSLVVRLTSRWIR
jgi:hypothetical protein